MSAESYPLYDYGGSGPVIHMALANGFPPETYEPLLHPLTDRYHVVCLPPRALWPGIGTPPEMPGTWSNLADDLLEGLRQHNLTQVIAIGHSFGAIASMLAVLRQPERFRGLVLLDPTIFAPEAMAAMKAMREQGTIARMPLVEQARVRRDVFNSEQEAFEYWREKPLFRDWSDEMLWIYTRSMVTANGSGLRWPREWEAYYYAGFYPEAGEDLARLPLPTLIIAGGATNAFVPEAAAKARDTLPAATHITIPDHGHLFPHSAPDATRQIIEDWLAALD
ncbi:MAG: alpha/beta hydrolase [Anaerolineae bacterium]|nr:alpha/beta hydrolase [Anaerolineae bacterium]